MKDATSTPERRSSKNPSRPEPKSNRAFKIVAVIFALAATFSLARQSPQQQDGLASAVSNPGDVMTGIDYFPAQFGNPAANQAPEQHIQAF